MTTDMVSNDYRAVLENYLSNEQNRKYSAPVLKMLLRQRFRGGVYVIGRGSESSKFSENDLYAKPFEICESLVAYLRNKREYDASVIPTIISSEQAPNFRIQEMEPDEETLWRFLYLLITGLHYREIVVNLDNVPLELFQIFRDTLIREEYLVFGERLTGLNMSKMLSGLKAPKMPPKEFILSFLVLTYFVKFWKDIKQKKEKLESLPSAMRMMEYPPISDNATLIVFTIPRGKKQMFVFPRLQSLITRWYKKYSDDVPAVARFVFSLYISDKKYQDKSLETLNKFLYYLLRNEVNGDLLNKLVVDKLSYELKKEGKPYGIANILQFLESLQFYE